MASATIRPSCSRRCRGGLASTESRLPHLLQPAERSTGSAGLVRGWTTLWRARYGAATWVVQEMLYARLHEQPHVVLSLAGSIVPRPASRHGRLQSGIGRTPAGQPRVGGVAERARRSHRAGP